MALDQVDTTPNSLLRGLIAHYEVVAAHSATWHGEGSATTIRRVISDLRGILENPRHRWVGVTDAARNLECSEETVRRKCREGSDEFQFTKAINGQYRIWLPDLNGEVSDE